MQNKQFPAFDARGSCIYKWSNIIICAQNTHRRHLMFLYIRCNIISMIFVLLLVVHSAVLCRPSKRGRHADRASNKITFASLLAREITTFSKNRLFERRWCWREKKHTTLLAYKKLHNVNVKLKRARTTAKLSLGQRSAIQKYLNVNSKAKPNSTQTVYGRKELFLCGGGGCKATARYIWRKCYSRGMQTEQSIQRYS